MSGRIFQNVVLQLKENTDRTVGVIDAEGIVIACSELSMIGPLVLHLVGGSQVLGGAQGAGDVQIHHIIVLAIRRYPRAHSSPCSGLPLQQRAQPSRYVQSPSASCRHQHSNNIR